MGIIFLNDFSILESLEGVITLFVTLLSKGWILKTLGFAILVGSIMELLEKSGAIISFVNYMTHKRSIVNSPRSALLISYIIGVIIFIESSITSMIAGAVGKPLCDREGVSHAKLAYVCDSTSAPISSLILFNGWGALLLGLIMTQIESGTISGDGVSLLMHAVVFNFYSISALLVTFLVIWFHLYTPSMQNTPVHKEVLVYIRHEESSVWEMLLPIVFLVVSVFGFLYLTGEGDIFKRERF